MENSYNLDQSRKLPAYASLTPAGVDYFERALTLPPSRAVGENSLLSCSGSHAYTRFGHVVEYESTGCENACVLLAEINRNILDLISQPPQLQLTRPDCRGRNRPHAHTPDFLEIRPDAFTILECKPLAQLKNPKKFPGLTRDESGAWRYPPAEEAARRLGMSYGFFVPEDFPKTFLTNLQIFARITPDDLLVGKHKLLFRLRDELKECPRTIGELCKKFGEITGAFVFQAIKRQKLFGLITRQHFDADFLIFSTDEQMTAHERRLLTLAAPNTAPLGPMHATLLRAARTGMTAARAAEQRFDERRASKSKFNATDYRYRKRLDKSQIEGAPRIAAFVPDYPSRGRLVNGSRLTEAAVQAMRSHWSEFLKEGRPPNLTKQYGNFVEIAEITGQFIPSATTYKRYFHAEVAPEKIAFLQGGKRAFHQARQMVDGANANARLAIAGLHVHIDGVFADVKSKADEEKQYLRPIFFPMVDDATGFVLGRGIKVGKPSTVASLMALRDCYLRHDALPAKIFHDWGSEFWNSILSPALDYFQVSGARRPAGASRFGGLGESFNAQLSAYLQSLAGGMYFDQAGRAADGNKKSCATAALKLAEIIQLADHWMFEIWNNSPIGSNTLSPRELFEASLRIFPEAMVKVTDDALSRYHTSYPLKIKKYDYVRGFRYGGRRFNSEELGACRRRQETLTDPRLDVTDPSIVRAMSGKGLIVLRSLEFQRIQGLGDGARLQHQQDLLSYASRAAGNQLARNRSEERKHLEHQKVADALRDSTTSTTKNENDTSGNTQLAFPSTQESQDGAEIKRLEANFKKGGTS